MVLITYTSNASDFVFAISINFLNRSSPRRFASRRSFKRKRGGKNPLIECSIILLVFFRAHVLKWQHHDRFAWRRRRFFCYTLKCRRIKIRIAKVFYALHDPFHGIGHLVDLVCGIWFCSGFPKDRHRGSTDGLHPVLCK